MALTHETVTRNAIADAVDDQINAGTTDAGGDFVLREGTTEIASFLLSNPAFGAAASGQITLAGTPKSTNAGASVSVGVDNFLLRDRNNTLKLSGSVTATGGGGDVTMDNTNVALGQTLNLTSLTYTSPS